MDKEKIERAIRILEEEVIVSDKAFDYDPRWVHHLHGATFSGGAAISAVRQICDEIKYWPAFRSTYPECIKEEAKEIIEIAKRYL